MIGPRSRLARRAVAEAEKALSPVYFRHSMRSYGLARAYADKQGLKVDDEGLFVAIMFHDVGLFPRYRDRRRAFQVVSADALRSFCEKNRTSAARTNELVRAVEYHMQPVPRWDMGNAAALVHIGAWMDVFAVRRWAVMTEARRLEKLYPRGWLWCEATMHVVTSVGSPKALLGMWVPRLGR